MMCVGETEKIPSGERDFQKERDGVFDGFRKISDYAVTKSHQGL
jgi:hypothetical protein